MVVIAGKSILTKLGTAHARHSNESKCCSSFSTHVSESSDMHANNYGRTKQKIGNDFVTD